MTEENTTASSSHQSAASQEVDVVVNTSNLSIGGGALEEPSFSTTSLVSTDTSSHPSHSVSNSVTYLGDDESDLAVTAAEEVFEDDGEEDDYEEDDELVDVTDRRRSSKRHSATSCRKWDADVDEQCSTTAAARAQASSYEYLCVWKHSEPTWESRPCIEEMGFVRWCERMDELKKPDNQGKPLSVTPVVRGNGPAAALAVAGSSTGNKIDVFPGQLIEQLGSLRIFLNMTQGDLKNYKVLRYAAVGSTKLERAFFQLWHLKDSRARPDLCYVVVDVDALHDMWAKGIRSNAKKLQENFPAPHDQYLWCCAFPEAPLTAAASGGPVALCLCAAQTKKPFLDSSWDVYSRKNGWFPMPFDSTKIVPLVVYDVRPTYVLEGMDVLLSKEPRDMESFTKLVEGLPKVETKKAERASQQRR